jgi:hypothetical protein
VSDLTAILTGLGGVFGKFQAASLVSSASAAQAQNIRIGGEIAATGALLSAQGFRQSAIGVARATEFNLATDKINNYRKMQSISRQFQRTLGRQITQQARSGIGLASKSALEVRNETLNVFGRAMINFRIDAENKRRATIFESQIKQTNLENQARAAEFRAQAERVMASNRAAEAAFQGEIAQSRAIGSAISGLTTLLG